MYKKDNFCDFLFAFRRIRFLRKVFPFILILTWRHYMGFGFIFNLIQTMIRKSLG